MTNRELAEALYELERSYPYWKARYSQTIHSLLQDDKDAPIYPYVCLDMAFNFSRGINALECQYLEEAIVYLKKASPIDTASLNEAESALEQAKECCPYDASEADKIPERIKARFVGYEKIEKGINFHDGYIRELNFSQPEDQLDITMRVELFDLEYESVRLKFVDVNSYDMSSSDCHYINDQGYYSIEGTERQFIRFDIFDWGYISCERIEVLEAITTAKD